MNNRRYLIHIPYFSEYLFRLINTLPEDRKKNLTSQERVMLSTPEKVAKVCANSPFEMLLFLYTKLGFEWTLNLAPNTEAIEKALEACKFQYDHGQKRLDATEVIARENACVVSSRDVALIQHMCAQNCNTLAYQLTYTTAQTRKFRSIKPYDLETQAAQENVTTASKLMLEQLNTIEYAAEVMDLTIPELKMMLALFVRRNGAMNLRDIGDATLMRKKKQVLSRSLSKLEDLGYVKNDRENRKTNAWGAKVYFMITTVGIQKVMEYNNYIWGKVFAE